MTTAGATTAAGTRAGAALSVSRLRKGFVRHLVDGRTREVLQGIDLDVAPGSCVAVTGASGSGKSSLLRCVYRTYLADSGSILVDAGAGPVDVVRLSDRGVIDLRATTMGLVTQFLWVTPRVGAADLVSHAGVPRGEAVALLTDLGLAPELVDMPPASFSGGERQLVNLGIGLACPRPLLLLDEATASLDPARRERVLELLLARKRAGTTILAVFHDVPATPGLVDRVVRLTDGRISAEDRGPS